MTYFALLCADAFMALVVGVVTWGVAVYCGCPREVAPFVAFAVAIASYASRISTEALMLAESLHDDIFPPKTKDDSE